MSLARRAVVAVFALSGAASWLLPDPWQPLPPSGLPTCALDGAPPGSAPSHSADCPHLGAGTAAATVAPTSASTSTSSSSAAPSWPHAAPCLKGSDPPPRLRLPPLRLRRLRDRLRRAPHPLRPLRALTRCAAAGVPPPPLRILAILGVQEGGRLLGSTKVGGGFWGPYGRGAELSAGAWAQQQGPPVTSW